MILDPIATAVNEITIQNSATGGNAAAATSTAPVISATGGDSNVDLGVLAKGTGHFTVRGTSIQGAIRLNCENNTHGQILQSQPHSAAQSIYVTLPSGTGSQGSPDILMSRTSTDTMTNKTLTAPTITSPLITTKVQASTNADDVTLNQYDATDDELLNEFLDSFKKCEDPEYKWVVTADCGVFFYFKTKEQAEDKARKMKEENYQWIEIRRSE